MLMKLNKATDTGGFLYGSPLFVVALFPFRKQEKIYNEKEMLKMAANVETMFYTRVAPWHGLGVRVETALSSKEALQASGLDWNVIQRPIMTSAYEPIPGYKANIRDTDNKVLGVVSDRYRVVQNAEAFAFTDALLGEGVK